MTILAGVEIRCPACEAPVARIREDAYDASVAAPLVQRHVQHAHGLAVWRDLVDRDLDGARRRIAGIPSHGTRACYQRGCERAECREANAAYVRERRRVARDRRRFSQ